MITLIVYADILFAVNFIMDYLALYVCSKVLNRTSSLPKLVCAAAIGGVYGFFAIFIHTTVLKIILNITVPVLMCIISFGYINAVKFLKAYGVFYAVNMLLAGIMSFLYQTAYALRNTRLFRNGVSLKVFFIFFIMCIAFIILFKNILKQRFYTKIYTVRITLDNKEASVNLLCDTGNVLRDPYTDLPVIIVEAIRLCDIIKLDGAENLDESEAVKYKFRYIPLRTPAGNAVMPGIIPDRITIANGKYIKKIKGVVALDISNEGRYGDNDGVIPYSLVSEI